MDNFLSVLKDKGKLWKAVLLVALGLILIFISASNENEKSSSSGEETLDEYRERLEDQVASLCSDVDGVGKCRVFITFERGAQNTYKGSALLETKPPKVLGVTVICRGADSDTVRHELSNMITALFDIGANRVAVLKLN